MNRYESRSVRTDHPQSAGEVFRIPMLLGAATAVGLISALLGDGIWDVLSWIAILAPILAVVVAVRRIR